MKQLADCLLSFVCLLLLALPFLLLGIFRKINSPRELVFFVQKRVGLYEKRFRIIIFRTMYENSCVGREKYAYDKDYVEKLNCWFFLNILVKTAGYFLKQKDVE